LRSSSKKRRQMLGREAGEGDDHVEGCPTDRLSDTQQRWIHILNSNGLETVVCQVKEGGRGMGIAGGHHQSTSSSDVTTAVMGEGGEVAGE
jgi:hypothetical protein